MKFCPRVFSKPMILWSFILSALLIPWVASAALVSGAGDVSLSPHDAGVEMKNSHNGHYFAQTKDVHHFAWGSVTPATPGTTTIYYDFRGQGGFANLITVDQKAATIAAFDAWSAATNGKIIFAQDSAATSKKNLINVGTGNLAALGFSSGTGSILALGGGSFSHNGVHSIKRGVAWQDSAESWGTSHSSGGSYDYFTVVAQEIGHALGLDHVPGSANIMNGSYSGKLTALSSVDIAHIQSIYGVLTAVPLPPAVWFLGSGLLLLFMIARRQQFRPREILAA